MSARYAIYYAPAPGSLLWQAGCRWLGCDPATTALLEQPRVPGCEAQRVHALTASARLYGLHATLKPPFHLAEGRDSGQLERALERFAASRRAFAMARLAVAPLGGFLALQPVAAAAALETLAAKCVEEFDGFRRPPDNQELARRRAAGLSARQEALLAEFGYPYVLDEFRFHITLTDRLTPAQRTHLQPWLADYFRVALQEALTLHDICLFVQDQPGARFRLARRYPFASH